MEGFHDNPGGDDADGSTDSFPDLVTIFFRASWAALADAFLFILEATGVFTRIHSGAREGERRIHALDLLSSGGGAGSDFRSNSGW